MTGFIFGGNTGKTAAALQRDREIAEAMIRRSQQPYRTLSDGIGGLADAYFGSRAKQRAEEEQKKGREAAWSPIAAAMAGRPMDGVTIGTGALGAETPEAARVPQLTPEMLTNAMGSGFLSPEQMQAATLMLNRHYARADRDESRDYAERMRKEDWARDDAIRAEDRAYRDSRRAPPQRQTAKGADGYLYYLDTGERVFPNIQGPEQPQPMTPEEKVRWGLEPDAPYVLDNGQPKLIQTPRQPDSVNVNVNTAAERTVQDVYGKPPTGTTWKMGNGPGGTGKYGEALDENGAPVAVAVDPDKIKQSLSGLDTADELLGHIDAVMNHPDLTNALGNISGRLPPVVGYNADVVNRIGQLQGSAFLQAFEKLKGGGQITEIEGRKAEDAIARLNRVSSDEAYIQALKDLRGVIVTARQRILDARQGNQRTTAETMAEPDVDAFVKKYGD